DYCCVCYVSFYAHCALRFLYSFPTRRSSDLKAKAAVTTQLFDLPVYFVKPLESSMQTVAIVVGSQLVSLSIQYEFGIGNPVGIRSEEHTSELQSRENLVCSLLREKKN